VSIENDSIPSLENAIEYVAGLNVPNWDADEEEGGVLSGLKSSNWKFRKVALDTLTEFTKSAKASSEGTAYATHVLVLAKFHTKLFKDSNFNILKAAIELFVAICDLYESLNVPLGNWMCQDAASICVSKISDKKFASLAPMLLSRLCELQLPEIIFYLSILILESIKSPVSHEGMLIWTEKFCNEFGVKAIGKSLSNTVTWLSKVSLLLHLY
jgi:hypothetical protein